MLHFVHRPLKLAPIAQVKKNFTNNQLQPHGAANKDSLTISKASPTTLPLVGTGCKRKRGLHSSGTHGPRRG